MRGEHWLRTRPRAWTPGSSPHARGALPDMEPDVTLGRIIPACAGSTSRRSRWPPRARDHPRMRGEHDVAVPLSVMLPGSSPHARGAHARRHRAVLQPGIIPACAGSTWWSRRSPTRTADHPRMRGEHICDMTEGHQTVGSSPHARGALRDALLLTPRDGIIPACAGSTCSTTQSRTRRRDHPRMRGEHRRSGRTAPRQIGSSPHARGALSPREPLGAALGIIPACAGSTSTGCRSGRSTGDHPRMRGEHHGRFRRSDAGAGSSPHARGAHVIFPAAEIHQGIIPACAGSTTRGRPRGPCARDHPRMRGEHAMEVQAQAIKAGSSPHARGAQQLAPHLDHGPGIIPACAGSTAGA